MMSLEYAVMTGGAFVPGHPRLAWAAHGRAILAERSSERAVLPPLRPGRLGCPAPIAPNKANCAGPPMPKALAVAAHRATAPNKANPGPGRLDIDNGLRIIGDLGWETLRAGVRQTYPIWPGCWPRAGDRVRQTKPIRLVGPRRGAEPTAPNKANLRSGWRQTKPIVRPARSPSRKQSQFEEGC